MKELEDIISEAGGHGTFQNRLLYLILGPVYFLQPLYWMNELFFLHVPNHWCNHPPGVNTINDTQFKECFIPRRELDNSFENCKMLLYNSSLNFESEFSTTTAQNYCPSELKKKNPDRTDIIETSCKWGWSYDKTEFTRTLVTDLEWFCGDAYIIPAMYTCSRFGTMIGGVVFNYLGDRIGRKPIFWLTTAIVVVLMTIKTFLAKYYYLYAALKVVSASTFLSIFQLPFTIICEVSDAQYRTWAILVSWLVWNLGFCTLPLIGWLTNGDWFIISLITGPPTIMVFFGWKLLPESPRWLLSRPGRINEAEKVFLQMAKVNKKPAPKNLLPRLERINKHIMREKTYGYISLFTTMGMAKKSILLAVTLTGGLFTYFVLTINLGYMGGSTYFNLFILTVVEIPATYFATMAAGRYGRRWSHAFLLFCCSVCMGIICPIANYDKDDLVSMWVVNILCFVGKFMCTAAFYMIYVQAQELNPTAVRNMGMAFASFAANIIALSVPIVVHLGTIDKRTPYGITTCIALISGVAASFLPETLDCSLPETISAAAEFGKEQKYFSVIRKRDLSDDMTSIEHSFKLIEKETSKHANIISDVEGE